MDVNLLKENDLCIFIVIPHRHNPTAHLYSRKDILSRGYYLQEIVYEETTIGAFQEQYDHPEEYPENYKDLIRENFVNIHTEIVEVVPEPNARAVYYLKSDKNRPTELDMAVDYLASDNHKCLLLSIKESRKLLSDEYHDIYNGHHTIDVRKAVRKILKEIEEN